ncbi:MAG: type III-B CRISPR module RAMP protein Cmr1, partial [bacterium]
MQPLFMGGADPKKAEWRAPSVKGLMRWWFRAAGGDKQTE